MTAHARTPSRGRRPSPTASSVVALLLSAVPAAALELELPRSAVEGHPVTARVLPEPGGTLSETAVELTLRPVGASSPTHVVAATVTSDSAAVELPALDSGAWQVDLRLAEPAGASPIASARSRILPGWVSILPPLVAIGLALLLRQVVPALFAGVWLGAWLLSGFAPGLALVRSVNEYAVAAFTDPSQAKIILFSMLLGGMVGIVSKAGGTHGIVDALSSRAQSSRSGQLSTLAMGLMVFFDDYANTLVVGNTMRPITDRLRLSREKLAYIVDCTAAPVASIALISTWIGFEVSLISGALDTLGIERDGYQVFLASLPYRFYPILALAMVFMVAWTGRDFGPMLRAERRAAGGQLMAPGARPLASFEGKMLEPAPDAPRRWWNAVAPVVMVVVVTFGGLWVTGRAALVAAADPIGTESVWRVVFDIERLGTVFGQADSYSALLAASVAGGLLALVLAVGQRILELETAVVAWIEGMKAMLLAFVILILAWSLSGVCGDLHTADYLTSLLSGVLHPRLLPALIFVTAAGTSFSTGSSWSTMGILLPLAVPLAHNVSAAAGYDPETSYLILLGSVSSVLAGSIFGDHCSPISDTTVLSSMASGCDHVDHVRTQLPYALAVGGIGILLGDVPTAFGFSPWLSIALGIGALYGLLRWRGQTVDEAGAVRPG